MRCWVLIAAVLAAPTAEAGKKKPRDVEPDVVEAPEPTMQAPIDGLFPGVLDGWAPGDLPKGLASLSAQGCNACHYQAHDGWAGSAHGAGGSDAWRTAASESGNPACTACHLPLAVQRPESFSFDAGDVNKVVTAENPAFDATLHTEGVTCAACHVRDGRIVAAKPLAGPPPVHPQMVWSEDLTSPEKACASCHQLSWPGADKPLYDTYGEWQRSAYAEAGVDCVTCHLGPGTADGPVSHRIEADLARALTVEIAAKSVRHTRGGTPFEAVVAVTNTGAGHAVPTGSPWRALQIELAFEGPGEDETVTVALQSTSLERKLSDGAPWTTTEDTRLQVGERREIPFQGTLDSEVPVQGWAFVVRVREVVRGVPSEQVAVERRLALTVE